MPKTKRSNLPKRDSQQVDWLWAAVLERKMVKKMDLRQMAEKLNVSYEYMRLLIHKSPWEWPYAMRVKVCDLLGLQVDITPANISEVV